MINPMCGGAANVQFMKSGVASGATNMPFIKWSAQGLCGKLL